MAEPGLRLRGQEVRIVVLQNGSTVSEINSITMMDTNTDLVIQEDGFLGEVVNRYDTILNGYGGNFELHVTTADYIALEKAAVEKAQRLVPGTVFNVVRVDLFADGTSNIHTFTNVAWGPIPENIAGRAAFVKVKLSFKCSEKATQTSAIL